jgi:HAD superfamily hydrolase (TIGR01549 family)
MISKYSHISFDLDGTLVSTLPEYRYRIVPYVVTTLGGTVDDSNLVDKFWFGSNRNELILKDFNLEPDKFWKLFRKIDSAEERAASTEAFSDVTEALKKLKGMDKVISIVTGAPKHIAELEIKKLYDCPFDYHYSIEYEKFGEKPNPESLNFVLEELNLLARDTVYIGNSIEDAMYAKNAGVDFIHIERNEHPYDLKEHAIGVINSLEDLF